MLLLASLIVSVSMVTSFQDTAKVQDTVKVQDTAKARDSGKVQDFLRGRESVETEDSVKPGRRGKVQAPVKAAPVPALAIVGVNVVPMDQERVLPNQTVVIRNGRIEQIGAKDSVPVPPGATVVEGRGRYLLPGL